MRLIDVDKINWQKGVFVNPNTDEPLPIIHKIATIEMLRDWQEEVRAIPLDKVKQTRETIQKLVDNCGSDTVAALNMQGGLKATLAIIDKLIAESEG
jgi:hypothetical protein